MRRIRIVLESFRSALMSLRHGATTVPLLLYLLFKLALILLYAFSYTKPLSTFWALLVPKMNPEALTHYPEHLLRMPHLLGRLDHVLDIVLLVLAQAMTILLFAAVAGRTRVSVRASARAAGKRYAHLVIAAAIAAVVLFAAFRYLFPALGRLIDMPRGIEGTMGILLGLAMQAFFLFALPFILLEGYSAPKAILASFRFAGRRFPESCILVIVPFILTVPTLLLSLNTQAIAFRISPDILIQAQIAGEIMEFVATYLLMGALTMYFIKTRSGEEKQ